MTTAPRTFWRIFPAVALHIWLACGPASAAEPEEAGGSYVAFLAGTWHVGNDALNNVTPGITFGRRGAFGDGETGWVPDWARAPGVEWHIEGGVFFNSYREVSPILMLGLSARVARLERGSLRLGASTGTAYYRALSDDLKQDYGIPNLGGFIPMLGLTAAWRAGDTDLRLTAVPPGEDTLAIFNLSLARRF